MQQAFWQTSNYLCTFSLWCCHVAVSSYQQFWHHHKKVASGSRHVYPQEITAVLNALKYVEDETPTTEWHTTT